MSSQEDSSRAFPDQKAILLRAWRERWPDIKWSVVAKKSAFEPKALAELMIQQATLTPCPNVLIMSYFKHALSTQMIPIVAGMEAIIKMEDMSKIYCIKAFVELIDSMTPFIWVQPQDPMVQAHTAMRTIKWLMSVSDRCLQRLSVDSQVPEHATVVAKIASLVCNMSESPELKGLLYVAQKSKHDLFGQINALQASVDSTLSQVSNLSEEVKGQLENALEFIKNIPILHLDLQPVLNVHHLSLNPSINIFMTVAPVKHLTEPVVNVASQLTTIKHLQGMTAEELFHHLIRSAFLCLVDSSFIANTGRYAAFIYLKLPLIIKELCQEDFSAKSELEKALWLLLDTKSVFDHADARCGCDTFVLFCQELRKNYLISDDTCQKIEEKRTREMIPVQMTAAVPHSWCQMMVKAVPMMNTWLEQMGIDSSKSVEVVLPLFSKFANLRHLEPIMLAAAAVGKVPALINILVKYNEMTKTSSSENGRTAQLRALLFDITFLMLVHITLSFGPEILEGEAQVKESFFYQWARTSVPQQHNGPLPCPEMSGTGDPAKVDVLVSQVYPGGELRPGFTRWHEVCHTIKFVAEEALHAWHQGALSTENIRKIIFSFTGRMCCLGVAMASHLGGLISCYSGDLRIKATVFMELIHAQADDSGNQQQYYGERHQLMLSVLSNLCGGVLPHNSAYHRDLHPNLDLVPSPGVAEPPKTARDGLYVTKLHECLQKVLNYGSQMQQKQLSALQSLLTKAGPEWFMKQAILDLFHVDRPEDLAQAVAILYGLIGLDVDMLTKALVHSTLPWMLSRSHLLTETRVSMLAKLVVMCLLRWKATHNGQIVGGGGRKRKRSDSPDSVEDSEDQPAKLRRLTETMRMASMDSKETEDGSDDINVGESSCLLLPKALNSLWRLFSMSLSTGQLTHSTVFVECLLEEVVFSGHSKDLLQSLSTSVITQLVQILPRTISIEILLVCCNLDTAEGCITAAKLICQGRRRGVNKGPS